MTQENIFVKTNQDGFTGVARHELKKVVNELSDYESRIVLKFADYLRDQKEELKEAGLAILRKAERQVRSGGFVRWRDAKRSII
jgi:hypothetical protein